MTLHRGRRYIAERLLAGPDHSRGGAPAMPTPRTIKAPRDLQPGDKVVRVITSSAGFGVDEVTREVLDVRKARTDYGTTVYRVRIAIPHERRYLESPTFTLTPRARVEVATDPEENQ